MNKWTKDGDQGGIPQGYSLWVAKDGNGRPFYQCKQTRPSANQGGYYNRDSAIKPKIPVLFTPGS